MQAVGDRVADAEPRVAGGVSGAARRRDAGARLEAALTLSTDGVALVDRARVSVVARDLHARDAETALAHVTKGADISVVTARTFDVRGVVYAGAHRAAAVERAGLLVIAGFDRSFASPLGAGVVDGARVAVIAGPLAWHVDATRRDGARVCRTVVEVVTHQRVTQAGARDAGVLHGAGVVVVARVLVSCMDAALRDVADVLGARVAVVAVEGRAVDAFVLAARAKPVADVAIIAVCAVRQRRVATRFLAPLQGADVEGAGLIVVAGGELPAVAGTLSALGFDGAWVAVVAGNLVL